MCRTWARELRQHASRPCYKTLESLILDSSSRTAKRCPCPGHRPLCVSQGFGFSLVISKQVTPSAKHCRAAMAAFGTGSCTAERVTLAIQSTGSARLESTPYLNNWPTSRQGGYQDPFDFVDECSRVAGKKNSDAYQSCMLAQWAEWQALMVHCITL